MARALTGGEKTSLRSEGQHSELFLAVFEWDTVLERRLNGVPSADDEAQQLTFDDPDGGTGAFGDVVAGETVYVSAIGYGGFEKGMARIRKAAGAATLYIGTTSEIDWTDNDYLTVVNEVGLWAKHPEVDSSDDVFMDVDVAYTDQHDVADPTPVLGPPYVAWLGGDGTVATSWDGSDSFVVGSSVASYLWVATGASATANLNTATPTITYDTAGTYRVYCTVTGANAATFIGYRYVRIFDASNLPATVLELENCSGDWQAGGWSFRVTMWDEALISEIRDRTLVTLFARDWYDSETSFGPVANRGNIIAIGHVDAESIVVDPEQGKVALTVQGPQFWLNRITGFPAGVEDTSSGNLGGGAATDWTNFDDLTVDKGLWHLLHWQSTATAMMDIQLTGDTRQAAELAPAFGPLWQQLLIIADNTILARPCCDRYGRLFIEVNSQLVPTGDRGSIPTVMDLESQDWRGILNIQRATSHATGQVNLSGVDYDNGNATPLFSLSPGHIPRRYGGVTPKTALLLESQAQANTLAGLILGAINNEYPVVEIPLASNHRGFDICPHQYATMSLTAAENERGITWSTQKLTPRRLSIVHNADTGTLLTNMVCAAVTTGFLAANGDPPATLPDPPTPDFPSPVTPTPDEILFPDGPVKATVAWTESEVGYTSDLWLHHISSTCTAGTGVTTLIDTTQDFEASLVAVGDRVENLTDAFEVTTIASVDSATQLTLTADINLDNTDLYHICGAQWSDATGTLSGLILQVQYVQLTATTVGAWALTSTGVYWTGNILSTSPTWTEKLTLAQMRTDVGQADALFRGIAVLVQDPAFAIVNVSLSTVATVPGSINGCVYTDDTGGSWNVSTFAVGASVQWKSGYFSIAIEQASGDIWCVKGGFTATEANKPHAYRSTDKGANFAKAGAAKFQDWLNETYRADFFIPYGAGSTVYYAGTEQPTGPFQPMKSSNTGSTFAQIGPPGGYTAQELSKGGVSGWHGDASVVYARFLKAGDRTWHKSTDGGATWSEIAVIDDIMDGIGVGIAGSYAVAPTSWPNDEAVLGLVCIDVGAGTEVRIRVTDDGGTLWFNMMGNWYSAFADWGGASESSGNAGNVGLLFLPRVGDNAV